MKLTNSLILFCGVLAGCFFCSCGSKNEPVVSQSMFLMSVPVQIKVYSPDANSGRALVREIFKEWERIAAEYNFNEPYSSTSFVNKKAYGEWVKVDGEFLRLLELSFDYAKMTGGAFDITFAPLWPIWKEAASSQKMPSKTDISAALENIGSQYVQVDPERKMVRFSKPVQINMGGILRGYCLEKAYEIIKRSGGGAPVEVKLGGYMLTSGARAWQYPVPDPFHETKTLGKLVFEEGVVMSSSGRDHFVQIEGKLYSHILDLKTGYPIENFSNLIVYYPSLEGGNYIPSAVLAVMGKEKAFGLLSKIKGTAAVWIDGSGKVSVFSNSGSKARWEKNKGFFSLAS
ncbi:MAG: FAD:protein FMN transferase [Elusimicrobia bacterium]|nr:FAD:protein FMN transferase [Elusimicrobiota bacterium]